MLKRCLTSIQSLDFDAILVFYLFSLVGLVLLSPYLINYLILWVFIAVAFLLLALNLKNSWLCQRLQKINIIKLFVILLIISIVLRLIFLLQKPFLSSDLENLYVVRSQMMLDGKVPYRDFAVNKPPLYAYLLYAMGLVLGAGQIQFRIFFSMIDSLIPIVIYLIGSRIWNKKYGIVAALAYSFCPIPLLEIGISGHYDSIPVLFVMVSFLLLLKEKPTLSGLSLGLAFAFKVYPIVLLPFFLIWIKTWKGRICHAFAFPIPMIISMIPIIFIYPSGLLDITTYQGIEDQSWGLISGPLASFFGSTILGLKISTLILVVFLFLILLLFYSTAVKKKSYKLWVKVIILVLIFMVILWILQRADSDLSTAIIALAILISIVLLLFAYIPLSKFLDPFLSSSVTPKDNLLIQSSFAILLLILGSAQTHAWYLLWILPFVLLIRTKDLKWFFLILLLVIHPIEYLAHPYWFSGLMYP